MQQQGQIHVCYSVDEGLAESELQSRDELGTIWCGLTQL
jgi:hypothetical protein